MLIEHRGPNTNGRTTLILTIISPFFGVEFVCVKSACSGSAKQTVSSSPPSAEQAANQSARTGSDTDIDQIAVTAIKAGPSFGDVSAVSVIISRRVIATSAVCSIISRRVGFFRPPVPGTTVVSFDRKRQPDCKYQKHDRRDQKLLHSLNTFLVIISNRREKYAKFLEREKYQRRE